MEQERPLEDGALLGLIRVEDGEEFPGTARVLGPGVCRHEGPLGKTVRAVVIVWSF